MGKSIKKNFCAFPRIALVHIYRSITRIKTHNFSSVPDNTSVLLAVNHTTGIDPIILLVALKHKIYFLADADNFKNRFLKFFMRNITNSLPLYPQHPGKNPSTLKEMIDIMKNEKALFGYFPEGRRHNINGFGKMYKGAAYFCQKLGIPLLPVYIHNHLKGPPRESFLGKFRTLEGLIAITINMFRKIYVFIGTPIYPKIIEMEKKASKNQKSFSKFYRKEIDRVFDLMVEQFIFMRSKAV